MTVCSYEWADSLGDPCPNHPGTGKHRCKTQRFPNHPTFDTRDASHLEHECRCGNKRVQAAPMPAPEAADLESLQEEWDVRDMPPIDLPRLT